jgi:hypothetical protein
MLTGPLFRREYQAATKTRRPFMFRAVFAVLLGLVGLTVGLVVFLPEYGMSSQDRVSLFGRSLFLSTIAVELVVLTFFVPAYVAGAIAEEREKDTFSLLLLTRLTPVEIAATKAVARWLPTTNPILTGLPVLVASGWLAGLEIEPWLTVLVLVTTSGFMATLSILASAGREQVGPARAQATGWTFGWLIGPPVMTVIPVTSGSLWGELLAELKSLCSLVAPSSPVSLLTDPGWYYHRPGALDLQGRVALMVGLQTLFGLAALGLAAGRLKAREKNPNWADPTRGYRPPCGDDPIFWREYELPMRRGSGSAIFMLVRYVWILIRSVLISLLTLLAVLVSLAIPLGLLIATIYYGSAAFRELWDHGYGPNGPFVARTHFNLLIRSATGLLGLLPSLGVASLVSARITTERDKKTWDAFLTTPLESEEILRSKARVSLTGLGQTAKALPILWAIGLACGVVTLPGLALAAVDLLMVAWANVALGLYLGLRPGTTVEASNRAGWWLLGLMLSHTPMLAAALASPRELATFATWDLRIRVGLVLVGLAVPVLTGAVAWSWTRRVRERFDEWVGRPIPSGRINPP